MFTITLESCSRLAGVRVHDALETVTTIDQNMRWPLSKIREQAMVLGVVARGRENGLTAFPG